MRRPILILILAASCGGEATPVVDPSGPPSGRSPVHVEIVPVEGAVYAHGILDA